MKLKADIGIFIGYSESSRGFCIYNCQTKKIMEMIHVKFDELTAMAFECNNPGLGLNCSNFQDSSGELNEIPLQQDLDNFFGPLYKEYYASRTFDVLDNSAANTLVNEDIRSSSLIIVKDSDAPSQELYNIPDGCEDCIPKWSVERRTFDLRFELIAYSDADLAGCLNDYKSTSGLLQFLGDKLVSWSSNKQDCTAMSTAEAKHKNSFGL
nr:retrovirus-related Pol polyprotein from transposon TNT 1-94 [Tanacetum cinerariifolium]